MAEPFKLKRIPTLKTPEAFREHVASLGLDLLTFDHSIGQGGENQSNAFCCVIIAWNGVPYALRVTVCIQNCDERNF